MFLLDELIYNVYGKFSHWKEEEEKKKTYNIRIYSLVIIYSWSFVFQIIQLWEVLLQLMPHPCC